MRQLSRHNRVEQHTSQAKGYAALTAGLAQDERSVLLRERIGANPDDEVLDVACGPGRLSLELAPFVRNVTGLDLTPAMLEQAREAQGRAGVANVAFVAGDAATMAFPDAVFSLAISSAAFHHFEAPRQVLAEMVRVCASGGRVVVNDVTPDSTKAAEYNRMERLRDPSHGHAHTVDEFIELGACVGLGKPEVYSSLSGPIPYSAVLATSFPEEITREALLELMRRDSHENRLGFAVQLRGDEVLVSYPTSLIVWKRP
ncbi:MAG: methyltransferase domain-containing protein [Novosphingobium sp.]|nr:methyltransferase domain-containing protein [Novosphingobium sp.]